MLLRILSLIQRAAKKPLSVVLFKLKQSIQLYWMHHSGAWRKIARKSEVLPALEPCGKTIIINNEIPVLNENQIKSLNKIAQNVLKSEFDIFGSLAPNLNKCDFSKDWRFNFCWPFKYFKQYSFYEKKKIPYDVKFPWELSRLYYLVPIMASQLINGADKTTITWVLDFLVRWRKQNPLAYSVNWYPMEASMRTINLGFILDFVSLLLDIRNNVNNDELVELHRILVIMLREHGEFIWVNREFTDVRGNHFTANLVALLVSYLALENQSAAPLKWFKYTNHWLENELLLQFFSDGVNFEKSCGYHKLVTELFVLAGIALEKKGSNFSRKSCQILKEAVFFSQSITRPDGLAANFGDNDDAVALPFTFGNPRSHGPIVELTRSWLKMPIGTYIYDDDYAIAALFIIGRVESTSRNSTDIEVIEFPEGGYTVVRNSSNGFFFMVDVGEVGMNGRGGHGHNDLLSFELCVNGFNVVIDPGCSGYTADLIKKKQYRSTSAHSTIQLYNEEIASITSDWTIENDAVPIALNVSKTEYGAVISAQHNGYCRIVDGSYISRRFTIDAQLQSVIVDDKLTAPFDDVKACWHYPIGYYKNIMVEGKRVVFGNDDVDIEITADLPLTVLKASFSTGYGLEDNGSVISLESNLASNDNNFRFCIRRFFDE